MDLVKIVVCALVSRVHLTFYILTKGYMVPGNQGTQDKFNQIPNLFYRNFMTFYLFMYMYHKGAVDRPRKSTNSSILT